MSTCRRKLQTRQVLLRTSIGEARGQCIQNHAEICRVHARVVQEWEDATTALCLGDRPWLLQRTDQGRKLDMILEQGITCDVIGDLHGNLLPRLLQCLTDGLNAQDSIMICCICTLAAMIRVPDGYGDR